jgi:hypothetical protein
VHKTTRIALPEPLHLFKGTPDDKAALGVKVIRTKPTAVLSVRPERHPFRGTLEFRGPTLVARLLIETQADGRETEIRVVAKAGALPATSSPVALPSATPAPTALPTATPMPAPSPTPFTVPTPEPTRPAVPTPTPALAATPTPAPRADAVPASEFVWARVIPIDRREGLPGQRPMILVDALAGRESIWFRFRLEGGASARVEAVTWENGDITSVEQSVEGKDRRIGVRLPRARVTPRTRLTLAVEGGPTYRFVLSAPTLSNALKSLFQ